MTLSFHRKCNNWQTRQAFSATGVFAVSFSSPTQGYLLVRECVERNIVRIGHASCPITHHSTLLINPCLPMLNLDRKKLKMFFPNNAFICALPLKLWHSSILVLDNFTALFLRFFQNCFPITYDLRLAIYLVTWLRSSVILK